ncbi:MAG: hypothetical protein KJO77_10440 [Bacteroidia bacterium]|nr:hypothetical protein [Bacteroidia bacterium]NND50883.1 hypothetical protein [Flavobacteriaceae bacterium]
MKTLGKQFKRLALFLSLLILFQSCVIYKKGNFNLDDAVYSNSKSEVLTNFDVNYKFKRIVQEEGNYYGLKKVKGDYEKTTLNPSDIKRVRIKDKFLSTILTILVPIGVLTVIGLAAPKRSTTTIDLGDYFL